jgi:putative nucleotidyltransferase with HDIG domain
MTTSIRLYVAAIAVAAGVSLTLVGWNVPSEDAAGYWNALAAFAVLGFLSEASYLRLRVGHGETNASVAFIPFIAAILLFDTGWAVAIAAISELAVEFAVRKKPAIKIVFNVSQLILAVAVASWVFKLLGGVESISRFDFKPIAIAGAVVAYFLVNSSAVSAAVAFGDQVPFRNAWARIGGPSLFYDFASSPLAALLAFLYVKLQMPGILVLIVPIWFVRHNLQVIFQLAQVNRDLLELMVKAIEARDPYTSGHSLRVAQIAEQIGREMGLATRTVEQIRTAALLHDVGKIHEDFAPLLRKNSRLDSTEKALMQTHPSRSAELVNTISAFQGPIEAAVRHHHENFDGSGYPVGLAGAAIPIASRIIMIADTMDAMVTDRPYRSALVVDQVLAELELKAWRQFDPDLVSLVMRSNSIRAMLAARATAQAGPVSRGLEVLTSGGRVASRA